MVQPDSLVEESDSLHSSPPQKYLRLSLDDNIGVANVETDNSIKAEVSHLVSEDEFQQTSSSTLPFVGLR